MASPSLSRAPRTTESDIKNTGLETAMVEKYHQPEPRKMTSAWDKTIDILREQPEHRMPMPLLLREMGNRRALIFGLEREDLVYEMRLDGVLGIDEDREEVYLLELAGQGVISAYRG
jgi:hypothetical protein